MKKRPKKRRSLSRLADWDIFERELREVINTEYRNDQGKLIKKAGEFPTGPVLRLIGRYDLEKTSFRYHGGLETIREQLGLHALRKPTGFWREFSNVERELREIIDREVTDSSGKVIKPRGEFPSVTLLQTIRRSSLVGAIVKYHGGMHEVRRRMGFPPVAHLPGYWKDWENVERELRSIIERELRDETRKIRKKAGEFPLGPVIRAFGEKGLLTGIMTYHGGLFAVRRRLGFEDRSKPRRYWKDFKNIEMQLRGIIAGELLDEDGKVIKAEGEFPSGATLMRIGQSSLRSAIQLHGGMHAVRQRMGFESTRWRVGYWAKLENIKAELLRIIGAELRDRNGDLIKKAGEFPTTSILRERRLSGMVDAILRYHGGISAVRRAMGFKPTRSRRRYWHDLTTVDRELRALIEAGLSDADGKVVKAAGEFPTHGELLRMGRKDLLAAMQVHHGGHRAVKAKMGFSPDMPEETVSAFVEKLRTVEGAEELARCPDMSAVDKADVLVVQHRDVFLSPAYVEYALRKLEDMPSFSPYVEGEPWRRGWYRTLEHFDLLVHRHPDLFVRPELFALVVRKLENVHFRRFHDDPRETLVELERRGNEAGLLSEAYARVSENLRKMQSLEVPGAVKRIKNPHWFEGSGLKRTVSFPSLHQKRGIIRIVEQKRVLIADEMGTGKTAQAILASLLLAERLGKKIRTLAICPSSVISWWREKIDEYCENISARDVVILASGGWRRGAIERAQDGAEFVLINYDLLSRQEGASRPSLVGELAAMGFDYVVADEVHHAKNMNANRAEAIQRITERVPYVALLSGTPIPNRLRDIGMTMSLLEPERYPTAKHFRVAYGNNPRLIRDALVNGRMLRVRSKDVFDLPGLRFREETVRLIPEQRDAYLAIYRDKGLSTYGKLALLRLVCWIPTLRRAT